MEEYLGAALDEELQRMVRFRRERGNAWCSHTPTWDAQRLNAEVTLALSDVMRALEEIHGLLFHGEGSADDPFTQTFATNNVLMTLVHSEMIRLAEMAGMDFEQRMRAMIEAYGPHPWFG